MKKFLLSLSLFAMTLMASAQEPTLKARSIYDVNQDDKVTVQDVPALANKLLGKADDKTAVDTQSLLDVLNNLTKQYEKILSELAELKAKQCNCTCSGEGGSDKANLVDGTFSVSSTKKVQFTKANLYWDGSAYHFEANQTDYPESWNANHVGHFYWTSSKDYQSGNTNYMPYAESYSYSSRSTSDKFFCGEDNPLTVDGTSGCFALSQSEWDYLISTRTNATNLRKYGVSVGDKANCLIIAPDGFTGTLTDCDEGTLEWVDRSDFDRLPQWEGDRIFLRLLREDAPFFSLKLVYLGDRLSEAVLNGVPMPNFNTAPLKGATS